MQRRVDRALRQIEGSAAAPPQLDDDRVAVQRGRLDYSQEQHVEMTLERFSVHTPYYYASFCVVSGSKYARSCRVPTSTRSRPARWRSTRGSAQAPVARTSAQAAGP